MSRRKLQGAAIAVLTLAAGVVAVLPAGAASAAATTTTTVRNTGHGYITTTKYPDGDSVSVYSASPVTMSAPVIASAATAGGKTEHSASGEAVPNLAGIPVVNGKPQLVATPSAYNELIAMGAPASVANQFKQLNAAPTGAFAPTEATPAGMSSPASSANSTTSAAAASTVIDGNNCASSSADGGRIKMYGCDTTTRVGTSGSIWYLEDNFLATGTAHDTAIFSPDELTGLKFGVRYGSGNQLTHWNPASTMSMGNCESNTVSVTYDGVSVSNTTTECPETFGVLDINPTLFTAKWDGQGSGPSNGSRESHGVDSVYNGASASPYPSLVWTYWWA